MSAQMWNRREPTPPGYAQQEDYDAYGNPNPTERKREKRRRDMVERVSRLHEDTVARRDRVFHDLSDIFARTADELLPPPVFPTFDLNLPVGQMAPSLPFTDPVIPDMHPTPFLFSLHRLSHQRENELLAIKLFHSHQVAVARKLYDAEVERIEDEYEGATKGVVERLLEGVEERRRRLTEEKEGEGVSLDTFLDPQTRTHGTRRMRGGPSRMHTSRPHLTGVDSPDNGGSIHGSPAPADAPSNGGHLSTASLLNFNGIPDPFNLVSTFIPSSSTSAHPLLSALTAPGLGGASLSIGPGGASTAGGTVIGKRKPGPRAQPGLPPAHYVVASGSYQQYGKSLPGLSALRGDEIDGDLGEVRRKRPRNGHGGSRRRANGE